LIGLDAGCFATKLPFSWLESWFLVDVSSKTDPLKVLITYNPKKIIPIKNGDASISFAGLPICWEYGYPTAQFTAPAIHQWIVVILQFSFKKKNSDLIHKWI